METMLILTKRSLALLALPLLLLRPAAAALPEVPTPRHPVTNTYHGVQVVDDYQWLEDAADPRVREWVARQNERTRAWFATLPYRAGIAQQLEAIMSERSASYSSLLHRAGHLFGLRFKPPQQQPVLVELNSVFSPALRRTIFDPNTYNTNGATAIDWFEPSLDGKFVAVSLSEGGSEEGTLHFFETATGKMLGDEVPRVQYPTGGGSAVWNADGTGVFYTRYPHRGERPDADLNFYQQTWFHRLGTPASADTYELGREFPRIAEIGLETSEDGRWVLATVANGDGGDFAFWLREAATGQWRQLSRFEDGVKHGRFGRDGALYLLSRKDAPRGKILRLPLATPELAKATVFVPMGKDTIQEMAPATNGLYVVKLAGGPSRLEYYPRSRAKSLAVPILPISTVAGALSWRDDEVVFANASYVDPGGWFAWRPGDRQIRRTALRNSSPVDFDDIEVVREFATSKDGTKVPLNILYKKGTRLDGQNPTLLYGYGGYSVSLTPRFDPTRRVWFDAGGVLAIANLRGGGEFGEAWHQAGNLTRKQNVFDDFIACAEHLIRRKYTSPSRLAVEGGSNGGLLMGAFLTQRPELARAVVSHVGIYDMLRVELDPNGEFNTTEFGTVKSPEQFRALYAYSPYHHVKDGTPYPAVLLAAGENDGRVNPAHSRKMTARLQAATSSGRPILLRSTAGVGHGIGSPLKERIALQADVYAFLFDQLGVDTAPWRF